MTTLLEKTSISLDGGASFDSGDMALSALTDAVQVRLKRPTSVAPMSWDATGRLAVKLVLNVDGMDHLAQGSVSGGIRVKDKSEEAQFYMLKWNLPYGRFGQRTGGFKRLGELAKSRYTARVVLTCLSGHVESELEVVSSESLSPQPRVR
jgi:hypothetical protein